MNAELSVAHLISQASLPVQAVMLLLLLASVASWAVIFSKRAFLARVRNEAEKFEERFWSGGALTDLYDATRRTKEEEGLAPIFVAGFEEYARQQQHGRIDPEDALAAVQRQMRVAHVREVERLEHGLSLLATIGSTSPYVGLLGTVYGIMNSFIAIGNVKQASLAMVAPGIAEALVATAMGLFAAIPAVVAYNRYSNDVERLINRYDNFLEEFSSILMRQVHA